MDLRALIKNDNKLFRLTVLMIVIAVCAMVAILVLVHSNVQRTSKVNQLESDRGYCETAISDFMNSSDYLTQQVRQYGLTGDRKYMDNYWNEINKTRTRDKAIQKLLHSDITEQETTHIMRAKAYSDELEVSETWAMRMIAESEGVSKTSMPKQVANCVLSDDDKALSSAEKRDKARNYLFGDSYNTTKQKIIDMTQTFRTDLSARMDSVTTAALNANRKMANVTWILIAMLIIFMAITILFYTRRATKLNRILEQSLEKAEAASESKSYFTSRMSHEIRTPLNAVLGYLTIADDTDDPQVKADGIKKSRKAANNLINIVNDVLDYSAIENGKLKLDNSIFSVNGIISDIEIVYATLAEEKNIELTVEKNNIEYNKLHGDRMRIEQILTNLMSNALKFTPSGGRVWLIASQVLEGETIKMKFQVRDTGIGISEEFLPHVFEAYEQQDSEISQKYGGTGLGMSIVKNLTEMTGGTVSVESTLGKGSEFTVIFNYPLAENDQNSKEAQELQNEIDGFEEEYKDISGMHILLAEDNDMNSEIAQTVLANAGTVVTAVKNGSEAVETFVASLPGEYDVILMDIMMPVMDGYEATKEIRESSHPDAEKVPIIAMTANAFSSDIEKALKSGMNAHIAKPIDVKILIKTLHAYAG